jgi:uncharacterized protein YoxC
MHASQDKYISEIEQVLETILKQAKSEVEELEGLKANVQDKEAEIHTNHLSVEGLKAKVQGMEAEIHNLTKMLNEAQAELEDSIRMFVRFRNDALDLCQCGSAAAALGVATWEYKSLSE